MTTARAYDLVSLSAAALAMLDRLGDESEALTHARQLLAMIGERAQALADDIDSKA